MSLFQELKRRNVFRVAVAYIIVGWLLLQVSDTLVPALYLPEWFHSGVAFIIILGFPIALILAWAFELTPGGLVREKEVDRSESITSHTGRKLDFAIIAMLVLAVIYFATDKFILSDTPETTAEVIATSANPSIAVLPFVNMSDDASNEYFADGITEELLNLLAKIPQLDVTSRSSAFAFKGKDIDIPTVAAKLNVDHILEGSVRKSGIRVRITAQLIDAETDKHLWSESYDRELTDIFAIQDEIAKKVVDALQVTLLGVAPTARQTNTDAYTLYLEGLHYQDLDGFDDWPIAQARFEAALEIDPDYAPAWLGRARAVREQANFGVVDLHEGTELARQWAKHALELDPTLAEGWALLSHLRMVYDWDWAGAREMAEKALTFGPNNADSLAQAAYVEQTVGRMDVAQNFYDLALARDPLSHLRMSESATGHFFARDYDRAETIFRRTFSLYPDDFWLPDLIQSLLLQDRVDEALELMESLVGFEHGYNFAGAFVFHSLGRHEDAADATQWIIDSRGIPLGYQIAEMYAWQEKPDKAFEWLDISFDNHDGGMTYLLVDPLLESLHDDPRWRSLLQRMNLLEYWDAMPGRTKT